jgi:hypothetical protein
MKVIIDNAIPYIKGILEPYAEVLYREGIAFSREDVADADLLIIRTRTRCNASLLDGSSVKMIATATIGFDHIDLEYCQKHGIEPSNIIRGMAAGLLFCPESDTASVELNSFLRENGVSATLEKYCGITRDEDIASLIAKEYEKVI